MVSHANSYNAASGADQLPLVERADELDSAGFKKSIDDRSFSDFGIDGSEKDWRQDANEAADKNNYDGKKKQNNKLDDLRDAMEVADEMQKARQEQMISMYGNTFSIEALQETAKDTLNDFERIARERGWDKEEQVTMKAQLLIVENPESTREDKVQALKTMREIDREFTEDFTETAENNHIAKNDNKIVKTSEANQEDIQAKNNFLSDAPDSFGLDKPDSEISSIFTDEVNGVGANARSFSLDEAPQIAVTEKAPNTFTLDA